MNLPEYLWSVIMVSEADIQRLLVLAWEDANMQAFIRVKIDYDGTPHHILASQIATTACYHQRLEWILVLKDIFLVDINSLVDTRNGAPLLWGATKNGDADCVHFLYNVVGAILTLCTRT